MRGVPIISIAGTRGLYSVIYTTLIDAGIFIKTCTCSRPVNNNNNMADKRRKFGEVSEYQLIIEEGNGNEIIFHANNAIRKFRLDC